MTDPLGGPYTAPPDHRLQRLLELLFAGLHREGCNGEGTLVPADKKFIKEIEASLEICGVSLADVHAFNGLDIVMDSDDEEPENTAEATLAPVGQ